MICSITIILISAVFVPVSSRVSKRTSYGYQLLEPNFESQSTNRGIVSIPNIIKENEYYQDDEGNNILISNFGEEEYECFGFCYCEEKRETSSNVISKRFASYLFVSVSSMLAYKKAKTYFDSKCQKELSEECHQSSIKSSVEDCSKAAGEKRKEITRKEKRLRKSRRQDLDEERVYFCFGNCAYNHNIKKESTKKHFKHIKCEKLKQEGKVTIFESELTAISNHPSTNFRLKARRKFLKSYLLDFCKKNSLVEYFWEGTVNAKGKKYKTKEKKIVPGCVGNNSGHNQMKNIRCNQVSPKPTNHNWEYILENFEREKRRFDKI